MLQFPKPPPFSPKHSRPRALIPSQNLELSQFLNRLRLLQNIDRVPEKLNPLISLTDLQALYRAMYQRVMDDFDFYANFHPEQSKHFIREGVLLRTIEILRDRTGTYNLMFVPNSKLRDGAKDKNRAIVGQGGRKGDVKKGYRIDLVDPEIYAVTKIYATEETIGKEIELQQAISKELMHPGLMQYQIGEPYHKHYDDGNWKVNMYSEFCEGGDLWNVIDDIVSIKYRAKLELLKMIFEAVSYMHFKNISHNDLKPENVVIKPNAKAVTPIIIDYDNVMSLEDEDGVSFITSGYESPEFLVLVSALEEDIKEIYLQETCESLALDCYYNHRAKINFSEDSFKFVKQDAWCLGLIGAHLLDLKIKRYNDVAKYETKYPFITGLLRIDPNERLNIYDALELLNQYLKDEYNCLPPIRNNTTPAYCMHKSPPNSNDHEKEEKIVVRYRRRPE